LPTSHPKNILIAPLDWGLGHTTRCVPLIRYIRAQGHRAIVAGNEWQRTFIRHTFPDIDTVHLDGYNVTYSKWNKLAQAGLLFQLPGLVNTINKEHRWLQQQAHALQLHGIISDNRYGLFHTGLPSVIMTHQLHVLSGMGRLADRMVQKIHYRHLAHFDATWVVDVLIAPGLGGILSHSDKMPAHATYVGLLSQFAADETAGDTDGSLLALLSGPEPQRSELSQLLWQQIVQHDGKVVFVEGSNSVQTPEHIPAHITYHKWLASEQLAPLLRNAGIVLCRSGYSTLMDLVAMGKKAILIPTPGQTEQEYLARQLHQEGVFYNMRQSGFALGRAMSNAASFPFNQLALQGSYHVHEAVLDQWLIAL